ncbi:MAG: asparagine synthase-related protein [Ktedonobacteraceae bacterium]
MPTLAGWLTGEQVPRETIEQTLTTMGTVLGQRGGRQALAIQPGAGLIAFADQAYAMRENSEPPVLDWVPDRRTMVYRRPLSGAHILYYVEDWPAKGNLLFASEIKALFAVGVPRRLRLPALDALLRYGFIPAPWTAFQDVSVVPAGSLLRWQRAKTVLNHATDYHLEEPLAPSNTLEQLDARLTETSKRLLPPHDQLMALASGDPASTLTIALAAEQTEAHFTVATLGYKKDEQEWQAAERVASAHGLPFLAITGVDQPEFWAAVITALEAPCTHSFPLGWHQLLHTASAQTGARVALSGLGAHTLLSTTPAQSPSTTRMEAQDVLRWYSQSIAPEVDNTTTRLWSPAAARAIQQGTRWEESLHARKLARRAAQFSDQRLRWRYLDLHLRLPDLVVSTAQQLATVEQVALRSPYLTPEVMDILTRLPAILQDGTPRATILSQLARLHTSGMEEEHSLLSLEAPTASLCQVEGSEILQQALSPEALRATGIFDPQAAQALVTAGTPHAASHEQLLVFTTQLLCLLFGASL